MKKFVKNGLALAAMLSLSLPLAAQAQVVSEQIILDPYNNDFTLEQLEITPGYSMELNLLNFSSQDLTFSSPELGLEVVVPANTHEVVYIDPATLAAVEGNETVAYFILDESGNQIASSTIGVDQQIIALQEYEQQVVATETTTTTTGAAAVQEEPDETERAVPVRGFW